jgi:uncharacterized short protein YbdD (DUF466 family)
MKAFFIAFYQTMSQMLKLMVGLPDYEAYQQHHQTHHPEKPLMTYQQFYRERQEARFGAKGKMNRCC